MPIERKLAAIMFTDIAGYTAQMSQDEAVAISLLNKKESVLKPLIAKHNGTYVKSTGDGSLSHFNSAVDAATCAKRFQESIYDDKDLNVRVGIHLGDTIFEKGDIRGDGVNIASRLESMAVEGGVFVSKEVHDQLANQKEFEGVSLGLQSMKGVGRLIEVYGLKGDLLTEPKPSDYKEDKVAVHTDDEVPSIAIIPFDNKGADEDVFYAYGISADLISDCSGAGLIRVASLKDVEKLDYNNMETSELSEKLLVRYIAQGTLWKMGDMFQLSVELYDTKDKKVVWSDRWQEKWDNLPSIKGILSDGLLKALDTKPKVEQKAETTNPESYEFYLKAKHKYEKRESTDEIEIIRGLLNKAIDLDDELIEAEILLAETYLLSQDIDKDNKLAYKTYKNCLHKSKKYNNRKLETDVLLQISYIHRLWAEMDTMFTISEEALEVAKSINYQIGIANAYASIAQNKKILNLFKGDKIYSDDEINTSYEKAYKIREDMNDKPEIAKFLINNKVDYFVDKKDLTEALKCVETAYRIYKNISDNKGYFLCYEKYSQIYEDFHNFELAIKNQVKAMEVYKNIFGELTPIIPWKLSYLYFQIGQYEYSLKYCLVAREIAKRSKVQVVLAASYEVLCEIYFIQNKLIDSIEISKKSINLFKSLGMKYQASKTAIYNLNCNK